jgi:hypothetical protein
MTPVPEGEWQREQREGERARRGERDVRLGGRGRGSARRHADA